MAWTDTARELGPAGAVGGGGEARGLLRLAAERLDDRQGVQRGLGQSSSRR